MTSVRFLIVGVFVLVSVSALILYNTGSKSVGSTSKHSTSSNVSGGSHPNASHQPVTLGVYAGPANPSGVAEFGTLIGQKPQYAEEFLDDTSWQSIENPAWFISQWKDSGYSMVWGVPMLPSNPPTGTAPGDVSLAMGASGAYDQYFINLAKVFVAGGQGSSIIRLGWEFNVTGAWYPWVATGQPANFVAYWRQIVTSMRSVPGADFKFDWNPANGDTTSPALANYYPGDTFVDLVGLDVYDVAYTRYPGSAKEFSDLETEPYGLDWFASFAAKHGKVMTLPEWGLGWGTSNNGGVLTAFNKPLCGGDDATFVDDMMGWISTHQVVAPIFWDYGQSVIGNGSNPKTQAALAAWDDHSQAPVGQVPASGV